VGTAGYFCRGNPGLFQGGEVGSLLNFISIFEKRWLRLLGIGVFIASIIPLKSLAQQANAQFPNSTSYSRSMLKAAWLDVHHTPVYYEGISVNPEAYYASDDNFSINGLESNGLPLIDIPWQIIDAWYLPDPQHKNSFAYGTLGHRLINRIQIRADASFTRAI
jgi:hypothetical protein